MTRCLLLFLILFSRLQTATAQREVLEISKIKPAAKEGDDLINFYSGIKRDPAPVSKDDFLEEYSEASAVYLFNNGYCKTFYDEVIGSRVVTTKRRMRVKVLSVAGLDVGSIKIPVWENGDKKDKREWIREIRAVTYNLNEKTGEIDSAVLAVEDIKRVNIEENLNEVSFAMPNVQVNSILDISYVIDSPSLTKLDDWYFQKEYPVKKSLFTFLVRGDYNYVYALQGQELLTEASTVDKNGIMPLGRLVFGREEWWYAENTPAFWDEPHTNSGEDNISKLSIQFESMDGYDDRTFMTSWGDVTRDLQRNELFKDYYVGEKNFQEFGIPEGPNSLVTLKLIYKHFKERFIWNGRYGIYPNVFYRDLMTNKKEGNTSALGLALYQILKQRGYNVHVILVRPRSKGKISHNYPFVDYLMATLVRYSDGDNVYVLDPVNDVPFGQIGSNFLNGKGLIIGETPAWQDLTVNVEDYKTSQVSVAVAENHIEVDLQLTMRNYGTISTEDPTDLLKSDWEVSNVEVQENQFTSQKLTAKLEQDIEDDLVLIPLSFDKIIFSENPFNARNRLYPIDFEHKKKYGYKLEVKISEEFAFDGVPESQIIKTSDGKLSAVLNVNQLGQNLNLTFLFWTKSNSFDVAYYPHLKSAYELMAELAEGSIIVRRKI